MKTAGTTNWTTPNTGATNSSGFGGLPGGYRYDAFNNVGTSGYWWSSTEFFTTYAWYRTLVYFNGGIGRNYDIKQSGFSVRCLRD